ncbi:MAG: hypothetical protein WKF87_06925 [Chryseolinea sp.]
MNKKIWNLETTSLPRPTGEWISIKPKSGTISFSRDLVKNLQLDGKAVNFVQNEDDPADWYLVVSQDKHAIPIRLNRKPGGQYGVNYMIQSAVITRAILSSCKLEGFTQHIKIGPITDDGYPILTKSARPFNIKSRELAMSNGR